MIMDITLTKPPQSGIVAKIAPRAASGIRVCWHITVDLKFAERARAISYAKSVITNLGQELGEIRGLE